MNEKTFHVLRIQKIETHAIIPHRAHDGDAGLDLYALEDYSIAPRERCALRTGIACAIPEGYVGLIWDTSGRALRDGLATLAGVIDSSYRGEIRVVLLNVGETSITIAAHERIAQLLVQPVSLPDVEVVDTLDETLRGDGGFGSTGLTSSHTKV